MTSMVSKPMDWSLESQDYRPPGQVMDLKRLGSLYQSRLSFARSLVRRMIRECWTIHPERFDLDENGFGDAVYRIETPEGRFSFVVFSQPLDPADRTDRVIAERWDLACALVDGPVSDAHLAKLRDNVPRQEAGRCDSRVLVLSRANRSERNFAAVLARLANGQQPDPEWLARVGYLYRTTAVYGNGKFGLADHDRMKHWQAFDRPFSAQMFVVFLVRQFSLDQIEHIARQQAPETAVALAPEIARYVGIGNSTGLGMAPFLINHPKLISQWVWARETALARVVRYGRVDRSVLNRLIELTRRARRYIAEVETGDARQNDLNETARDELQQLQQWLSQALSGLAESGLAVGFWSRLLSLAYQEWSLQTQEMIVSQALEVYPALVDDLEDVLSVDESEDLQPEMPVEQLLALIESRYDWALEIDFAAAGQQHYFWYRSVEKEEPRLGERDVEPGANREMPLGIARDVQACYRALKNFAQASPRAMVVEFLLAHPEHRQIARRIQNMGPLRYGEIRGNLLARDCLPIDLLRCKLSFFGASKFDSRSDRWVRITLFQGAPLAGELDQPEPDWFLPLMPGGRPS